MSGASRPLIAVLDYGIGNLRSAEKALQHVGADARLTADPTLVERADAVVLPGVGAFGACMDAFRAAGLEQATRDAVASGRPFLGICVGMQMLFSRSEEDPDAVGLGIIPGTVRWIPPGVKRPQMQWNRLQVRTPDDPIFAGLTGGDTWMYFVHSLHGVPDDASVVAATTEYGTALNVVFRSSNVVATQFHPEKSAHDGLRLLENFTRIASGVRV
ncbi:MAG: imidazole glycerol phosphate synthase subunit HisH [Actinomycetota bacterium]